MVLPIKGMGMLTFFYDCVYSITVTVRLNARLRASENHILLSVHFMGCPRVRGLRGGRNAL